MPITLPPISRRRFVVDSLGAAGASLLGRLTGMAAPDQNSVPLDSNRIALLADTHIDADPKRFIYGTKWPGSPVKEDEHEGVNMADCLERVVADVLAQNPRPAHAIVNGDCARTNGNEAEYREFLRLIHPIREAGITVHLTIGNHDNRKQLWKAAPDLKVEKGGRHVGTIALPKGEIVLLDSERSTLGAEQLTWLHEELADHERKDLPMLGFLHYNPYPRSGVRPLKGLNSKESDSLLALVAEQKRAKALFFGHTHDWNVEKWIDVHMINQPPVGYYFGKGKPHGWLDMNLTDSGAVLQMQCINSKHAQHGEQHELLWR